MFEFLIERDAARLVLPLGLIYAEGRINECFKVCRYSMYENYFHFENLALFKYDSFFGKIEID